MYLWGIVAESTTGLLKCGVSCHSRTKAYSGVLINDTYEPKEEWHSKTIDAQQAQDYFEQLEKLLLIKKNQ